MKIRQRSVNVHDSTWLAGNAVEDADRALDALDLAVWAMQLYFVGRPSLDGPERIRYERKEFLSARRWLEEALRRLKKADDECEAAGRALRVPPDPRWPDRPRAPKTGPATIRKARQAVQRARAVVDGAIAGWHRYMMDHEQGLRSVRYPHEVERDRYRLDDLVERLEAVGAGEKAIKAVRDWAESF